MSYRLYPCVHVQVYMYKYINSKRHVCYCATGDIVRGLPCGDYSVEITVRESSMQGLPCCSIARNTVLAGGLTMSSGDNGLG